MCVWDGGCGGMFLFQSKLHQSEHQPKKNQERIYYYYPEQPLAGRDLVVGLYSLLLSMDAYYYLLHPVSWGTQAIVRDNTIIYSERDQYCHSLMSSTFMPLIGTP